MRALRFSNFRFLFLLICMGLATFSYAQQAPIALCGDVNCDGEVDIVDALLIAQYYVSVLPTLNCCDQTEPDIPELTGVDGYIVQLDDGSGRYRVHFATNGIPTNGTYCCPSSLEAAINAYPSHNLVYLNPAPQIVPGIIPPLNGVDGYIMKLEDGSGRYIIRFANNGILTDGVFCCCDSTAEALSYYPNKNIVILE